MRTYLIDGYNLLHQVPELECRGSQKLEEGREKLIRRLVALTANRKILFHLVFDTSCPRGGRRQYPGVRVDYASPSADAFIRHIITENQNSRDLVIVSSDRNDIGNYARVCGLEWMTSQQFWAKFKPRSKTGERFLSSFEQKGAAPPGWTPEDDAWLRKKFEGDVGEGNKEKL